MMIQMLKLAMECPSAFIGSAPLEKDVQWSVVRPYEHGIREQRATIAATKLCLGPT